MDTLPNVTFPGVEASALRDSILSSAQKGTSPNG